MKKIKMPTALGIVMIFLAIVAVLTWIVPTSVVVDGEIIYNAAFDADGNVIQNILSGVPLWAFVIAAIAVYCLIALVLQSTSGVAGITMPIFGALAMGLFATASCGSVGGQVVLMSSFTVGINFVCGMYPESTNMGICEMVNMPYPVYLKTILKFTLPLLIVAAVIISVAPYVGLA